MPTHSIFCSSNVVSVSRPIKLHKISLHAATKRRNTSSTTVSLGSTSSPTNNRGNYSVYHFPTWYPVLWSRYHGLETRMHSSSFCPGLGLQTWWPRSRSWSQDSMLGAYARSTITVICSTFTRVLCGASDVISGPWSRDHGLETMVSRLDSSALEITLSRSRSRSRSRDLKAKVSVLVSRHHAWCLRL